MTLDISATVVFFLFSVVFLVQKSMLFAPLRAGLFSLSLKLKVEEFDKTSYLLDKVIYMINCGFCLSFWVHLFFLSSLLDMRSFYGTLIVVQNSLTHAGAVSILVVLYSFLVRKQTQVK